MHSQRAGVLAARLGEAVRSVIDVIAALDPPVWSRVPAPGVWSIGKDAEHIIEAGGYHLWIVRVTIGTAPSSRRPKIERARLVTDLSPREAIDQLDLHVAATAALIRALTDEQLDLPTRPPRAGAPSLDWAIDQILIAHVDSHRDQIEAKARSSAE